MRWICGAAFACLLLLGLTTACSVSDPTVRFSALHAAPQRAQVLDRHGVPLSYSYQDAWNLDDQVALGEIPGALVEVFVAAEDQRFRQHRGVDWQARLNALLQNLKAGRTVRGASTITEQLVRILQPRPRNLWARWLEGWEAMLLERSAGKSEILEMYLNQVPYAAHRRGVVQAARYYFDRELGTLNHLQMQTLAVLVRAPSALDPRRGDEAALRKRVTHLRRRMGIEPIERWELDLAVPREPPPAAHFVRMLREAERPAGPVRSTLDAALQGDLTALLQQRLAAMVEASVGNGAIVVVDHHTSEVLAWVVAGARSRHIDAVRVPRQPGSTLKPFLYAMALERGWQADTLIDDKPLATPVGRGLHRFRNYSRSYHGEITLRQALGNSLNLPAVRAAEFVGVPAFLGTLRELGFAALDQPAEHYGVGLVLGNGEVTLQQLVSAYAALANKGVHVPLRSSSAPAAASPRRVFSPEVASLVANILADADARRLQFGGDSVLNFPRQTAVKTGTSQDHRDAWAVGFDDRYVVGVWLGNLDRRATRGLSGARGPALLMRSAFSRLNRHRPAAPLWLSPRLVRSDGELRLPGSKAVALRETPQPQPRLVSPTPGLVVARDPRLPIEAQAMEFRVEDVAAGSEVRWRLNGEALASLEPRVAWPLVQGEHRLAVVVRNAEGLEVSAREVQFLVR